MDITFISNMLILFGICIVIAIMQKKGMMTANRFALILAAYFLYFTTSAINAVDLSVSQRDLKFEVLLSFGISVFVYLMARWIYGQWYSRNS